MGFKIKKLIITEGENDSLFLKEVYNILNFPEKKIKIFDQNVRDTKDQLNHAETRVLGSFKESTSPYDILIKSEAGKTKAIPIYSTLIGFLYKQPIETMLMLDLDNQNLDDIIFQINKFLKKRRGIKIKTENIIQKNDYFKIINCSIMRFIKSEYKFLCDFSIFVFKPTLEVVTGIEDSDIPEIKKQKILKFLETKENIPKI